MLTTPKYCKKMLKIKFICLITQWITNQERSPTNTVYCIDRDWNLPITATHSTLHPYNGSDWVPASCQHYFLPEGTAWPPWCCRRLSAGRRSWWGRPPWGASWWRRPCSCRRAAGSPCDPNRTSACGHRWAEQQGHTAQQHGKILIRNQLFQQTNCHSRNC